MGLFNIIDPALDVLLSPLARLHPGFGLLVITLIVSLAIVLIYKLATDQEHMRSLREQMKKLQEKMKGLKENPEALMLEQKKLMSINLELMKHSLKPTLYTFIPVIVIFGWLSSYFAYAPEMPGEAFNVSVIFAKEADGKVSLLVPQSLTLLSPAEAAITEGRASWTLQGEEGEHILYFDHQGQQMQKGVVIANKAGLYVKADKVKQSFFDFLYASREGFLPKESEAVAIRVNYEPLRPLPFSLLGWKPGWLGTYIIFSLIFSMALRKLLKVY